MSVTSFSSRSSSMICRRARLSHTSTASAPSPHTIARSRAPARILPLVSMMSPARIPRMTLCADAQSRRVRARVSLRCSLLWPPGGRG
eukprot:CAMPEP_0182868622 /NCGR_PEP_ID=MMETSP0034_2-20130328/9435_1 /TAXON_ID=156128 /ORGANISM="Nephroselmis pyriformis, Strain CCMP717" /LENGTH=87 /DNA_ID=CAMNT_0025001039 /DNA_START=101 /DNA_END=361 /DNA_ORIENTATION=-